MRGRAPLLLDSRAPVPRGLFVFARLLDDSVHHLLQGGLLRHEGGLLFEPAFPPRDLVEYRAERAPPCGAVPPIEVQRGFETAVPHQHQLCFGHNRLGGGAPFPGREAHGLAQRMAEQIERILHPASTKRAESGCCSCRTPILPGFFRHGDGPSSRFCPNVCDEPHAKLNSVPAEGRCSAPRRPTPSASAYPSR